MTTPHLVATGLIAGLLSLAPALAAEPKPDLAVKTRFIDASVTLDKAIRADAPLAANLLAEGKRWLAANRAEAAKEFKSSPELFRDGRAWTFDRTYSRVSVVGGRYVSVLRSNFTFTGGAHPNTFMNTILWDDTAGRRINIRRFFKETTDNGPTMTALRNAAIDAVKAEKKARKIDDEGVLDWYKDIRPTLTKVGAIALAPSQEAGKSAGLRFYYPPYAVGPYAEGSFVVFVPWQSFKGYLSSQGAAIFAGGPVEQTGQGKP